MERSTLMPHPSSSQRFSLIQSVFFFVGGMLLGFLPLLLLFLQPAIVSSVHHAAFNFCNSNLGSYFPLGTKGRAVLLLYQIGGAVLPLYETEAIIGVLAGLANCLFVKRRG